MSDLFTRTSVADLEVRSDGRTVVGLAVPFGVEARVSDDGRRFYMERFERGAFARTILERGDKVKFLAQHQRQAMPLGRVTLLREDPAGLYMEARVSKTSAGDEALELIRDGALDSLSVSFQTIPDRDRWSADHSTVTRTEVRLREISAVAFPAYEGALISAVRAADTIPVEVARRRLALLKLRTFR